MDKLDLTEDMYFNYKYYYKYFPQQYKKNDANKIEMGDWMKEETVRALIFLVFINQLFKVLCQSQKN